MPRLSRIWPLWLAAVVIGCGNPRTQIKIEEASNLAAQQLGQKPAWSLPWDSTLPDWTADGMLRRDEAVGLALRNNRTLRADIEMIGQADADLVQAGLMQNPMINFMAMFPDGGGRAMLRATGIPLQPLQDLWLIPARRKVAAAALQEAVLRVASRAIETATMTETAYVKVQYAQRAIELMRENIDLAEQSTRIIQTRQAAGQSTQVEVNMAQIRAQQLRSELLTMQTEYRAMKRELLLLIGLAGAPDRWTVEPVHEMDDPLRSAGNEEELVEFGTGQRLDLKAAEWSLQSAEHRVTLMRREGLPELALGFSFERAPAAKSARGPTIPARVGNATAQAISNRIFGVPAEPEAPQVAPWTPQTREVVWTLGPMIEMTLPIFDQNQAQIAKAMHEYNQKLADYEARLQEITRDIRDALVRQQEAREQVEFYRTSILPDVQRNMELAQQTYIAGQESLTVFLQAQEDLVMTRLRVLDFLRAYLVSSVDLERAIGGRLVTETPTTQPATGEAAPALTAVPPGIVQSDEESTHD